MDDGSHLRDYQSGAADSIDLQFSKGQSTLAVMATGLGKTVVFAEVVRRRRSAGRTIVLCHREELILQARQKIEHFTGIECEIEMADQIASTSLYHKMPVVIATIQTLVSGKGKRIERFKPEDFATVILDEAHHGCAASFKKVIDYFRQNPLAKILGVTATPDRTDEEALGQIFESVAINMGILEGVDQGWLVPVEQQMVTVAGLDFSGVKTTAGDLNGGELAAIMEAEKNLHELCSATLQIAGDRQTIVFTASVKHAEMACNILNRHRDGIAQWICGKTPKENRRSIIKNMHSGKTQILVNVGVATEGFDCPAVEVIVMGRPTKSRSLYSQMAGRATRPLPGIVDGPATAADRKAAIYGSVKKSCLIVDLVGNSGRHKLVTTLDILGGKYSEEERELAREMLKKDGENKNTTEALDAAAEKLAARRAKAREEAEQREEERKRKIKATAKISVRNVSPFDVFDIVPDQFNDSSRTGTLSAREKEMLLRAKLDPNGMTYAEGAAWCAEIDRRRRGGLCTVRMAKQLKKYGYDPDMKMGPAGDKISAIIANGWKRPNGDAMHAPAAKERFSELRKMLEKKPEPAMAQDEWF